MCGYNASVGMVFNDKLKWWPFVADAKKRSNSKIWSLVKLREGGASSKQLAEVYIARARGVIEYGDQVYGCYLVFFMSCLVFSLRRQSVILVRAINRETEENEIGL